MFIWRVTLSEVRVYLDYNVVDPPARTDASVYTVIRSVDLPGRVRAMSLETIVFSSLKLRALHTSIMTKSIP